MYKLLIVEDDKVLKFGLKKCLEEEGYSVIVSENDAEVSNILKSESIDLVILDVNLPRKDGFEIYRQMVSVRKIPAVFLTARDEEDDIVKGFDLGAEDYITKPFSVNVLLKKVAFLSQQFWCLHLERLFIFRHIRRLQSLLTGHSLGIRCVWQELWVLLCF